VLKVLATEIPEFNTFGMILFELNLNKIAHPLTGRGINSSDIGKFFFPLILLFFVSFPFVIAQDPFVVHRFEGDIVFDGIPDEDAWGKVIPLPVTTLRPVQGKEPSEKTEILIGYSDEYLWIGGRFYDSDPSQLQYSKKRDDSDENNDVAGILIDCLNDNENAFLFGVSPAGNRFDMTVFNDARVDSPNMNPFNISWNTFWDVKSTITEKGWFAEIRIPFSSLRFKEMEKGISMGMTAYRWIPRKNEMIVFPVLDPKYGRWVRFQPSLAHDILLQGIKPTNPVYITPYLLGGGKMSNNLDISGSSYKRSNNPILETGLDLKYGISSNLTLDLTINTDFAQIEIDDQQVNITRYSLFYPEKRIFFQERSDLFNFNLGNDDNIFYSRRIGLYNGSIPVRIYGGARVTGKIGKFDVGFINMQTAKYTTQLASENFNVLRLKHKIFNPYSYAGGILTSRIGTDGSYNITYGLDSYIRAFKDDYIDLKFSQSYGPGIENKRLTDNTFLRLFMERRNNKGWGYRSSLNWSGNEFIPAIGFLRRVSVYSFDERLRYGWVPGEHSFLYTHQFYLKYVSFYNTKGILETINAGPGWSFETRNKYTGEIEPEFHREILSDTFYVDKNTFILKGDYSFFSVKGKLWTPASSKVNVKIDYELGQYYDGSVISLKFKPQWSVSHSFKLDALYLYNRVHLPSRNQRYLSHVLGFKSLYMFSTKLSASAFIQYNSAENVFLTNLRIRLNPREGNDFYIVFNEGRNTDILREPIELPQVAYQTIQFKYSYTFIL
jgi:hypothetical protein